MCPNLAHKHTITLLPQNACPALTNSVIIPVAPTTSGAQVAGPEPNNPLPSIRVNTLEPCAEFGCRTNFALARQSDGTIVCRVSWLVSAIFFWAGLRHLHAEKSSLAVVEASPHQLVSRQTTRVVSATRTRCTEVRLPPS